MPFIGPYVPDKPSAFSGLEWIDSLDDKDILFLFAKEKFGSDNYIPRGQDFSAKHEILFSGCSETHGDYLTDDPESYSGEDIWGFKIAKYMNKSAINLGLGGASAYEIVKNILLHVTKENKPSYIFCLFPDLNRLTLPTDPNILIDKIYERDHKIITSLSTPIPGPENQNKYSKKPHLKEDVIPKIIPVWLNLKSIAFLETFCELSDITLRYSTWSDQTHGFIEAITKKELERRAEGPTTYLNYVYTDTMEWLKTREPYVCNKHHEAKNKYFAIGKDGLHMGTHRHEHIAENILNSLTI